MSKPQVGELYKFKPGIGKIQDVFQITKIANTTPWGSSIPRISYAAVVVRAINRELGYPLRIEENELNLIEKYVPNNLPLKRSRIVYGKSEG